MRVYVRSSTGTYPRLTWPDASCGGTTGGPVKLRTYSYARIHPFFLRLAPVAMPHPRPTGVARPVRQSDRASRVPSGVDRFQEKRSTLSHSPRSRCAYDRTLGTNTARGDGGANSGAHRPPGPCPFRRSRSVARLRRHRVDVSYVAICDELRRRLPAIGPPAVEGRASCVAPLLSPVPPGEWQAALDQRADAGRL